MLHHLVCGILLLALQATNAQWKRCHRQAAGAQAGVGGAALAGRGESGRVSRRGSDALTRRERNKSCDYAAGFWAETPLLKNVS